MLENLQKTLNFDGDGEDILKQCIALEEKFLLLEALKIIQQDPKRKDYNRLVIKRLNGKEQEELSQKVNKAKEDINQKPKKEKNSAIASLFEEMMSIVNALKQQGFKGYSDLLHRVNCAKADFYFKSHQEELFFRLYGDYFIRHPDPKIDFKYAKRIFEHQIKLGEGEFLSATGHLISLLGLFENRLRHQYFIQRLENNKTRGADKLCNRYREELNYEMSKSTHSSSSTKMGSKSKQKTTSRKNQTIQESTSTDSDSKKQTAKNLKVTNTNSEVEKKVSLKHTLAQSLGYGVYEDAFKGKYGAFSNPKIILPATITWNHSRIVSANRIALVSSDFTYDQMVKILQIEYAALPNDDKKATLSFFNLRFRTLEKSLEAVFEKENILPIDSNAIKNNENLSLASSILQWIGDQERSFYYKTLKNLELRFAINTLGKIAHKIVVCDNPETLAKLKTKAKKELDKVSSLVDVTFLTEKLNSVDHGATHPPTV